MIPVTRPFNRHPGEWTEHYSEYDRRNGGVPELGAPAITAPLPVAIPGQLPFVGMDPSNPVTWIRPYNPQPGMITQLNFNGAAVQGNSDMGGLWSNPADWNALAGARPRRRPR